jgi:hypothetical protein
MDLVTVTKHHTMNKLNALFFEGATAARSRPEHYIGIRSCCTPVLNVQCFF